MEYEKKMLSRVFIAVTGASGSIYAERLVNALLPKVDRIYLSFTDTAKQVLRHELSYHEEGFSLVGSLKGKINEDFAEKIKIFSVNDFFAPIASGSSAPTHMVITPCSMGTLARVTSGFSGNLIERTADVMLKQALPLVLVPRESPLIRFICKIY